jgi:hypothetical protein
VGRCELESSGAGCGPVAGCFEHDDKPSGFIKGGKFLDQLSDLASQERLLHGDS